MGNLGETIALRLRRYHMFYKAIRRGRMMSEGYSQCITIRGRDLEKLGEPRPVEYDQYGGMIIDQIPRFQKYLRVDKFSRRLIIQFPMSHWEGSQKHYMPCIESFMVQFVTETRYIVCINFRSSEASRTVEDLALVKKLCENRLGLGNAQLIEIYAHFFNVHEYLDGGTSDDFTARSYREVKDEA